jgi:hypothetical protein
MVLHVDNGTIMIVWTLMVLVMNMVMMVVTGVVEEMIVVMMMDTDGAECDMNVIMVQ